MELELTINGFKTILRAEPYENLRDVLRRNGYTAVKRGCDVGGCGACTVLVNGRAVYSCCTLAAWANGKEVLTLEGLAQDGKIDPIQQAFIEKGGAQCGFCTPGFVMTAKEIIEHKPDASEQEIRKMLSGNLCRCTGYVKIVEAVIAASDAARSAK
jgi:aerobic-type carbon monoxide dehydrogenase small subunit (CoxS/CutS family)